MILYGAPMPAPNPRRVRIFLAEKAFALPETPINMMAREHKGDAFMAKNSLGQLPTLELDDGTIIAETVSICRYFEEIHPAPPLFGTTAVERAQVDMWIRRVEFVVMNPVRNFWRHAHPRTAKLLTQFQDFGNSNRAIYLDSLKWIDRELAGRSFVAGADYTMADICLLSTVDFAAWIGLEMPAELTNLAAWHERVSARGSAKA
jgi:glutathione S-transferase